MFCAFFCFDNLIARIIVKIILMLLALVSALSLNDVDNVFFQETESFLSSLPYGLQQRQTNAIRKAIDGDSDALNEVRNSRNAVTALPDGVSRVVINDTLTLFRSDRYSNETIPLLVYFHGGGWTIGSINSCSRYCAALAGKGVAVLAVNYRLAPEHPFPAGLDDCIASVKVALDSLDAWKCGSVSVGGDSSGGNLAIAAAMSFPKDTFKSLVLFYPVTKAFDDNSISWKSYGAGYGLDSELMNAFNEAYTSDYGNPLVSPALASDSQLEQLPPVMLMAADYDILKDQGQEFAYRIRNLGVETDYSVIPGTVHLFITVAGQPAAFREAVTHSSAFIRSHQ